MRLRFDQLGKQIGLRALDPSGPTVAHDEIASDAQHADLRHEPDPARAMERARLGLLGRLASVLCLVEIYSRAPGEDEVLACVGKLIAFRRERARRSRQARAQSKRRRAQAETSVEPFLWIIAAGRPAVVLTGLRARAAPGWPKGVYFGPDLLRVGIVVASELPRKRETLLVRLMAAGPLLPQALEELSALPAEAHERAVAEQILLHLQHVLRKKPSRTPEEQEFIVTMHKTWEDARRDGLKRGIKEGIKEGIKAGREEGHTAGREEGRAEALASAVLTTLRVRGIAVSDAVRARVLAEKDRERLERWLERAVVAASVDEVIDERS